MKRSKIILGVLILSMIALVFSGCGGSGGVPTVPSTPGPEDSLNYDSALIQVKDPESNIIFMAGKENKDAMAILGEKDNQGDPTKITGFSYVSEQGDAFYLEAGIDGLPNYIIDAEGNKITFVNYTISTVDITVYDSNGNLIESLTTIDINPQNLLEIKQLYDSSHLKQKYTPWWGKFIKLEFIEDWALNTLKLVAPMYLIFDEDGNPIDYLKPWEVEVNIFGLLTEYDKIYIWPKLIDEIPSFLTPILDTLAEAEEYVNLYNDVVAEILEVLDNFNNAIVNQNWAKAKSYCVVGSEEYEAVDELEDLYDELSTLCNDINMSCSGGGVSEVIISGKFAVVSGYNTCTVSCIPPGGEEISVIASGEGSSYLEKVGDSWKIYKESGDPIIVENF